MVLVSRVCLSAYNYTAEQQKSVGSKKGTVSAVQQQLQPSCGSSLLGLLCKVRHVRLFLTTAYTHGSDPVAADRL